MNEIPLSILRDLLSTSSCGTGAVPKMSATGGFATITLDAVIRRDRILEVFERHGVSIPECPYDCERCKVTFCEKCHECSKEWEKANLEK